MLSIVEARRRNKEIAPLGLRLCSGKAGCGRELPFDQFYKRGDGLAAMCRECYSNYKTTRHKANPNYWRDHNRETAAAQKFYNFNRNSTKTAGKYGCYIELFTEAEMHQHWVEYDVDPGECFLSGSRWYEGKDISYDHMVPLSRLGAHAVWNIRPACNSPCNKEKHDKTVWEYRAWIAAGNQKSCRIEKLQNVLYIGKDRAKKAGVHNERIKAQDLLDHWGEWDIDPDLCGVCHRNPTSAIDHIVEMCKGGPHTIQNLLPVCDRCNHAKKHFDSLADYFRERGRIEGWVTVDDIRSGDWGAAERRRQVEVDRMAVVEAGRFKNQTECLRGHLLDSDNVPKSIADKGQRSCRACMNARTWFKDRSITPTDAEFQTKAGEFYAKFMPQESVWKETENDDE